MKSGALVSVVAFALLAGCGGEESASCVGSACTGGPCDPTVEACTLEHDVSTVTIAAGVEDEDLCQSWTLNNPHELWVNGVSQTNDGAYHHANWFFVPDDEFDLPDGEWRCSENDFNELDAALLGGYLFALSTQSQNEAQALPAGSAIRIPPYSRVIGSSHMLNASADDVTTTLRVALSTIPLSQVKAKMAPARIEYRPLAIDPMATSSFTTECTLADSHQDVLSQPLQYELHYLTGHYHNLGSWLELSVIGGDLDGQVLMRHDGYGENFGVALDPPVELGGTGATGLRFTCGYDNPRNETVGWGIGDQEMCVIALQARSNFAFDADGVDSPEATTETQGGVVEHNSPCTLIGFEWDFQKAGGPPR